MNTVRPMPLYVRMTDAPQMFAASRSSLYEAAARGEITIYKPIGTSLLKMFEVEAWVEARTASVKQRVKRVPP